MVGHYHYQCVLPLRQLLQLSDESPKMIVGIGEGIELWLFHLMIVGNIERFMTTSRHHHLHKPFLRVESLDISKQAVIHRSVCHSPLTSLELFVKVKLVGYVLESRSHQIRLHVAIIGIATIIEMGVISVLAKSPGKRRQRCGYSCHVHHAHCGLCGQCAHHCHHCPVGAEGVGIDIREIYSLTSESVEIRSDTLNVSFLFHDIFRESLKTYQDNIIILSLGIRTQRRICHLSEYPVSILFFHIAIASGNILLMSGSLHK